MKVHFALVGLPRYFDSNLPSLVSDCLSVSRQSVRLCFWKTQPGTAVAQLSPSPLAQRPEDWMEIQSLPNTELKLIDPVVFNSRRSWLDHPQVDQLQLKPNASATMGWLSALVAGIDFLHRGREVSEAEIWVVTRPDIKIWRLKQVIEGATKLVACSSGAILTAARPMPHRVLGIQSEWKNLPIDHILIGRPRDFVALQEALEATLSQIKSETFESQPLVNEFLLGDAIATSGLVELPILIPYLIWRGSLVRSFTSFDSSGLSWMLTFFQAIEWIAQRLIWAGKAKAD